MSYLCNRKWGASVAEQVDALDSKSSGVKPVPVRFRPDVQNERGELAYPFFFCLSSTYIRQDCTTTQPTGSVFSILFWLQGSKMLLQYHKNLCRILRYFAMKSDEKIAQRAIFSHLINSNYLKNPFRNPHSPTSFRNILCSSCIVALLRKLFPRLKTINRT